MTVSKNHNFLGKQILFVITFCISILHRSHSPSRGQFNLERKTWIRTQTDSNIKRLNVNRSTISVCQDVFFFVFFRLAHRSRRSMHNNTTFSDSHTTKIFQLLQYNALFYLHTHTHSLSLARSHTHAQRTHSSVLYISNSTHTQALSLTHSLFVFLSLPISPSLSTTLHLSLTHTLSLSMPLSLPLFAPL